MAASEQTAAERRRLPAGRRRRRGGGDPVGITGWKEASEAISDGGRGQEGPAGGFVNERRGTVNCFL